MRSFLLVGILMIGNLLNSLVAQELDYPSYVFDTSAHEGHCVNVTSFAGVDPTGATDSTVGIQNAIYSMYINNGGGVPRQETIYFPNGTYLISKTLDALWNESTTGTTSTASNTTNPVTSTITNLATTAYVRAGDVVVCTDFPSGTTVKSVNAATNSVVVDQAATGSHAGIAVSFQSNLYRFHFVGQSESGVIIKLGNAVSGFTSPSSPMPMIKTESDGSTTNDAFDNCVWNLTLDTGTNNPGAVGISYLASNCASIRNVTIKAAAGSGYAGVQMTRQYPGPCMIENLEVDGFATGVQVSQSEYCATFEGLTLKNQTTVGVSNSANALFIRNLTSTNTNGVPVITNGGSGLLVLIDSTASYTGGGTTTANAINNSSSGTNCGGAFLRNVTTSNYALAVSNPNTGGSNTSGNAPNGTITEYSTHPALTPGLPGSLTNSLDLPIQPTPHFVDNNFADWYNVATNIAPDQSLQDESPNIQAAIDAAAAAGDTTLAFPPGKYYLAEPVYLHGSIRRVLGFGSVLMPFVPSSGSGAFDSTHANTNLQPIISVGGGPLGDVTGSVEFDQFTTYPTSGYGFACYFCNIAQNTAQTVTLVDMGLAGGGVSGTNLQTSSYQSMAGAGNLFIDDCDGSGWYFNHPGQQIWARQLDPEGATLGTGTNYAAKVTNNGSTLWVLGLKTEDFGTLIESTNGASTEVLGAMCYPVEAAGSNAAYNSNLFDVQNSDFSGSYVTFGASTIDDYPNQVGETENTSSATLYDYTSTSSPNAYLRKESGNYSMAPIAVATPTLALAIPGIDIGTVGLAGTASVAGSVFTVAGAGAGVSGTTDAFHFCSESVTGDCTITAELTNLNYSSTSLKAGVMIRDTTAPNSDMVMCSINKTTGETGYYQIRSTVGGSAVQALQGSLTLPYWVRLQRSGNSFTSFISPDGVTWTQLGQVHTFTMSSTALVGLGVTSGSTSQLCTGTFSNVTITTP